jgi:hypothetical protein
VEPGDLSPRNYAPHLSGADEEEEQQHHLTPEESKSGGRKSYGIFMRRQKK